MSSPPPPSRGRLLILYGSQTGCAEEVARAIADEASRLCYATACHSMEEYDVRQLPAEAHFVAVASTTGEGEVPDGMRAFWRFLLRKDLPNGSLGAVRHACFGLGDSSYPKFNYAAKRLGRRLEQLGSAALVPIGLGDDQDRLGLDEALGPWLQSLWNALDTCLPLPAGLQVRSADDRPPARFEVSPVDAEDAAAPSAAKATTAARSSPPTRWSPFPATVLSVDRLTSEGCGREVNTISLNVGGWGEEHAPGDALAVQPLNPLAGTRALVVSLGLDPDAYVDVRPVLDHAPREPRGRWSVLELFRRRLDIFGVPRRRFFALLAHFANDPLHAERLAEFGAADGAADLLDYATRPRRTCAEVLLEFPSARPPLAYYLDLLPPLRERYFSIASSAYAQPTRVDLCVAIVRYQTALSLPRFGVCSTFLASLERGATVDVWLRKGCLTMPESPTAPLVMVGPGTGVAPFRSFVQTRRAQREAVGAACVGPAWLFFGCRHPEQDHLYAAEWEAHEARGDLQAYHVAYSRLNDKKVYVQHKMVDAQCVAPLWEVLRHPACHVYIAGAANRMPKDVRKAIEAIAQACGGMDEEAAKRFISQLEASRRLQCETW
jgi:sulfite reductase alpha subunit-like flavoprotein